jgi:hypothetical protein
VSVAATVSVLPLGVIVTLLPAAKVTLSSNPLMLLTTCPGAIFPASTAPSLSCGVLMSRREGRQV